MRLSMFSGRGASFVSGKYIFNNPPIKLITPNITKCMFGKTWLSLARKGAVIPPIRVENDTNPMALFLIVVGNISLLWIYTTEKLADIHSFPTNPKIVAILYSLNTAILSTPEIIRHAIPPTIMNRMMVL